MYKTLSIQELRESFETEVLKEYPKDYLERSDEGSYIEEEIEFFWNVLCKNVMLLYKMNKGN